MSRLIIKVMLKRFIDISGALLAIIIFMPVMLFVAILIFFKMGRPIFFIQKRPGYRRVPFDMYKFRTLSEDRDRTGNYLPDQRRINKFGMLLRSTSLDELPELWNVLKGDMSLVGPRPLLLEYLPLYDEEQNRRHEVKPGITGWAQINGRNAITWTDKFKLDVWYVDNYSIWLDIKIIFMTPMKVFSRSDISSENQVTSSKFEGKDS